MFFSCPIDLHVQRIMHSTERWYGTRLQGITPSIKNHMIDSYSLSIFHFICVFVCIFVCTSLLPNEGYGPLHEAQSCIIGQAR